MEDRRFIPFFVGEVIPASETNGHARALAAFVARYMYNSQKIAQTVSSSRKAKELLDAGCTLPFVRWVAAIGRKADYVENLEKILVDCDRDGGCCAVRMLALHSIWLYRKTRENRRRLLDSVVAWANARDLRDVRAHCAILLIGFVTGARDLAEMSERIKAAGKADPWLSTMLEAVAETDAAWKSRGKGWAMPQEGMTRW